MDTLVLIRAADALRSSAVGARLSDVILEVPRRFRIVGTDADGAPRTILISINPEAPWIGRPWRGRGRKPFQRPDAFTAAVARRLRGSTLTALEHTPGARIVSLEFSTGDRLVAELQAHRAQLLLIDSAGLIVLLAGRGRSKAVRWKIGEPYTRPDRPESALNPFEAGEERLTAAFAKGELTAIARSLAGIDVATVDYIRHSAAVAGQRAGSFLVDQLDALQRGLVDPVIEYPGGDAEAILRPWKPPGSARTVQESDAAATVALFHGAAEERKLESRRLGALRALLKRQTARLSHVEARIESDLSGFSDPDRHRLHGEALLAGLAQATRAPEGWRVPDPYHPDSDWLSIPEQTGLSAAETAEKCFARHRRSLRGLDAATRRREEIRSRRDRLLGLLELAGNEGVDTDLLEQKMRHEGIPIGLVRTGSRATPAPMVRLEGVRMFHTEDEVQVLVGKSGRDNHRLTFRLASPDDFWLHASGVPGAHVIIRNPDRTSTPAEATLRVAAEAAAYYSDNRAQGWVDVQWTRRKFVRKVRGAAPGTVQVKKSSTVRVRPTCPSKLRSS